MSINNQDSKLIKIEELRQQFVLDYNPAFLRNMTIEQYAMGGGRKDNLCYRLEHEQEGMGRITGALAGVKRYGVWYSKDIGDYDYSGKYGDSVDSAFLQVKRSILELIEAGERDDYKTIRESRIAGTVRYKIIAMYYPNKYLTIYSPRHLSYFCSKVGIPAIDGDDELIMQNKLMQWKESQDEVRGYTLLEYVKYLYDVFGRPPKDAPEPSMKPAVKKLQKELKAIESKTILTEVEVRQRSAIVTAIVKERAAGVCQLCHKPAPFYNKKGEPYLECHHVTWLAHGGADDIDNAVALCPNCHRRMHELDDEKDVAYLRKVARS